MRSCIWAGVLAFVCFSSAAAQAARDLVGIGEYATASGKVEVHVLSAATQYQQSVLDVVTPWYGTPNPPDWIFRLADVDGDGRPDLVGIGQYNTPSGRVELHVLSGASQYQQQILAVATPWYCTPTTPNWTFTMSDIDRDGKPDLVGIANYGMPSGRIEVHVLSGASAYQQRLADVVTPWGQTPTPPDWIFALADIDGDGKPDLVGVGQYNTPSGMVELHALSGVSNYQQQILAVATPWYCTPPTPNWSFRLSDVDGDGKPDLVGIANFGIMSGRIEVHALTGASNYQQRLIDVATPWGQTPTPPNWTFEMANLAAFIPVEIVNRQSGKALDVTGASTANGIPIQQYNWLGFPNQQWRLVPVGAHYKIVSVNSGKVLDVTGYSTAAGATIQQWDWLNGLNQQWDLAPVPGDGRYYEIVNVNSGKVLDVTGGNSPGAFQDGAPIQQYDWLGSPNQQWQISLPSVPPTISLTNLTHPNLSPNFEVGDTYRIIVTGAPNQPVSMVQTANGATSLQSFGSTDSSGHLTVDYVEQTNNVGSYTQVWSVGNVQATPAVSFVVGQFSATGTVTTTDVGQTSDGHLEGVSSLSITNGVVSTYSATTLDYTASLYYDSDTVATLFDEGVQVKQTPMPINSSTAISLSANATAWHDYDLQTDHYAIAYFLNGGYYENPLYWGSSCYDETGDCTINGSGGYAYWITAAAIYVGSTLADQGYVPQDGSLPPFDLSAYNGLLSSSQPPYDVPTFRAQVTDWIKRLSAVYVPIKLLADANNANTSLNVPPIPFYVDLVDDTYGMGEGERQRTFIIKDLYGRPWNINYPLSVRERFSNMAIAGGIIPPMPDGVWYNRIPQPSPQAVEIDDNSQFTDHHRGNPLLRTAQASYLQYYYAADFTIPPYLVGISSLFAMPGISTGPALPLWIKDTKNKCSPMTTLPAEGINLNAQYIYIDGDNGPGTGCQGQ